MNLADTNDLIRVVTSSTADVHVSAEWADWPTAGGFTPGHTTTLITTATTTTVVAAPAASTVRQVRQLVLANRHASTANTVSVEHFDNTNAARVFSASLAAGESVSYDGTKWVRYNANGYVALEDSLIYTDALAYYANNGGGGVGYVPVRSYIRAGTDQTLTSTTSAQNIFDSPAGGALTIGLGTYFLEYFIIVTGMSATSGNAAMSMAGTAVLADIMAFYSGIDNTTPGTILDDDVVALQTFTTAASVVTAGTGTALRLWCKASFECSTAGTIIPSIALVTAAAATVEAGSWCFVERIGAAATNSVGSWA